MYTTWEVKRSRSHLKFLSGNYLTYKIKSDQSGGSPRCRICETVCNETYSHLISTCQGLEDERQKILPEFEKLCSQAQTNINFQNLLVDEHTLCQFIIDPTSLNLSTRISLQDPVVPELFKLTRDFCHVIDKTRIELLQDLSQK